MAWGVFYRPTELSLYDCEHDSRHKVSHSHPPSYIKEYPSYNHPPPTLHRHFGPTSSTHTPPFSSSPPNPVTPRFRVPLSGTILEDPAFSSDPRTHPHFPLANAGSFRAPPPKSPHPPPYRSSLDLPSPPRDTPTSQEVSMPVTDDPPTGPLPSPPPPSPPPSPSPSSASVSLDSDSHTNLSAFTSPTVSSATSHTPSSKLVHGGRVSALASPIQPSITSPPPMPPKDAFVSPSPTLQRPEPPAPVCSVQLRSPEIPTKSDRLSIPTKTDQVPLPSRNNKSVPRRGRVRNLVRRLTNRHNLDRIDELDETDPFGGSYHHDGPYEAITTNLAELGPPHKYNDIEVLRGIVHNSKHKFLTPSSRSVQYQSTPQESSSSAENGLSLHLQPGQVLRQNTIYTPTASGIPSIPRFLRRQSVAPTRVTRLDHSRSQSLPNSCTHREDASFMELTDGFKNQSATPPRAPRIHYFGDDIPRIPNSRTSRHKRDHDAAPCALPQGQMTFLHPPQHESISPKSSSPESSEVSPSVPPNLALQQTRATESTVSAFPPRGPQRRVTSPSDNPGTVVRTPTHSSSNTQDRPSEPPRIRHLPKRLVMPAPLQPQLPQPQYDFPPANLPTVQDEYADDLSGAYFEGQPAMYNKGPRLLRKRSSAFPAKMPIPEHVPVSQGDTVPVIENSSTKADNEAERIKEGTRRRRLSKRKNDT